MAYTTINKSTDFFNTVTYTGNGSTQSVTGVGFQPDWTWCKQRNTTRNHGLFDAVRGVTKILYSNDTSGEATAATSLTSFNSDGFSCGGETETNQNGGTYVSWNWKGGTAISGNTGGSGTSRSFTGRINTTSKFGIYTYQGNGTGGHTIPHGLGAVPTMMITKRINASELWVVYHQAITASKYLRLNTDQDQGNATNRWNGTEPTSTVFTLGSEGEVNGTNDYYITYVFCDVPGYAKMGSYTGNGNADGAFVYTGFKPAFIMTKSTAYGTNWSMMDNKRFGYNTVLPYVYANATTAEQTNQNVNNIDILSNGFKCRESDANRNANGNIYTYMAFAEAPLVGTNNVACTSE